jgi:hypothetical protein
MAALKAQGLPPQLVPGKVWRDPEDKKLKVVFGRTRFLACQAAGVSTFDADELDSRLKPKDIIELAGNEQARRRDNSIETIKIFVKKNYPQLIGLDLRGGSKLDSSKRRSIEINGEPARNAALWLHKTFRFAKFTCVDALRELNREARGEPDETRFQHTPEQMEEIRKYQERYWTLEDRANEIAKTAAEKVKELREKQSELKASLRKFPGGPRQLLAKRPRGM